MKLQVAAEFILRNHPNDAHIWEKRCRALYCTQQIKQKARTLQRTAGKCSAYMQGGAAFACNEYTTT
jgi:hypothetical protein